MCVEAAVYGGGVSGAWRVVFDGWRFAEGVSDYLYDSLKAVGSGGECITTFDQEK